MEKIPSTIHESWHIHLQHLFDDDRMKHIKYSLLAKEDFLPESEYIFRVFSMPIQDIKIVILGQDPYPTPGHAVGLAFVVNEGVSLPFSLRTIYKEILSSGQSHKKEIDGNFHLYADINTWTEQGVFLLNTALTVKRKTAGSHLRYWQFFTEEIVKIISREVSPIWVLWGAKAQAFEGIIRKGNSLSQVLRAPHPAAEAYSGGTAGFLGCNHFKEINEILLKKEQKIINF